MSSPLAETLRQAALLATGALQDAILRSANFSSIATDAHGVIQIFNVGAQRMLGYAATDVIDRLSPADLADPQELIERAQALSAELGVAIQPGFEALVFKASRGIEDIYDLTCVRHDGSRFPAVVSVTALRAADGVVIGYLLIGTDNTARKQLADELRRYRHQLEELVYARTAELAESRDAAEAANRAKSMFLAKMSHELRTPMNGILGMTELALRRATDPRQAELLQMGAQAARTLHNTLNDILDVAALEADQLSLHEARFSPALELSEAAGALDAEAVPKGLRLTVELGSPLPACVHGDATRLRQILHKVIGNAVKFSEHGDITVRASVQDDDGHSLLLRIEVSDQGMGMSAVQQTRLFRVFTQADGSNTRQHGGCGLGLVIARRLARLMGGDVGLAHSSAEGSTFWMTARFKRVSGASQLVQA